MARVAAMVALVVVGLASCGESSPDIAVSIVSPKDGAEVSAGEAVKLDVQLQGAEIAGEGHGEGEEHTDGEQGEGNVGHLHVFVDGQLESMPETLTPEIELEPGTHTVMVEFVDVEHRQLEPRITDEIELTAA